MVAGLAIALCSAAPLLQNVNNTDQSCTSESNISLYNQLSRGTITFPQVRLNITSDQILENTILSLAQRVFNGEPKGKDMNFNIAGDATSLNDVCRRMVGKLFPNDSFMKNYNCPWEYKCDYDPHRIPQVLWQADCNCSDCTPVRNSCVPVYYPVPVLYTSNCSPYHSSGDWKWKQIKVAVSCASKNKNDPDFS